MARSQATAGYQHTGQPALAALMNLAFNVSLTLAVVPLETQMAILAGVYFVFALVVTLVAGLGRLATESDWVTVI